MPRYRATIHVTQLVPTDALDVPEDRDVAGDYELEVMALDEDTAEEHALDWFHSSVPIGFLEDFNITVELQLAPKGE